MPDPNRAPPGYFRDLQTMAEVGNTLDTLIREIGTEVEALPVDDPVRVAVEGKVAAGTSVVDSSDDFQRLRPNDPNWVEP